MESLPKTARLDLTKRQQMEQGGEAVDYERVATQRRAYFVYGLALISLSSLSVFIGVILFINHRYFDFIQIGGLIIFYIWLISRLKAGQVGLATLAITLVGGGGYFILGLTDTAGNTGLMLFNTFPILVFFLHGRRRGILLTLIFTGVMLVFYGLDQFGIVPLPYSTAVYRNFVITFVITVVMVYFYQDLIDASERIIANRDRLLADERDRAKAVVTAIGEGVLVIDEQGKITDLNPVAENWLNLKRQMAITRRLNEAFQVYQKERPLLLENYPGMDSLKSGQAITINQEDDYSFQPFGSQKRFPVSVVAAPLQYEHKVTGVVIVFRDITSDKQAAEIIEQEVRQRTREVLEGRARLLASINSLDLGYMMTNDQPAVVMVNKAAITILAKAGLMNSQPTESAATPTTVLSLEDIDAKLGRGANFINQLKRCMTAGQIVRLTDLRFGKVFLAIIIAPINFENKVVGTVIVIQDVTEAKVLDRAKDEFFTIASHELRTPLTIIRGTIGNIESIHPDHLKDQALAEKIRVIQESCVRLINIVNDFLTLSRLEQGRVVYNSEVFTLDQITQSIKAETALLIKGKPLTIQITPAEPPLPPVWADKDRVRQILLSLVSNAIKFTARGAITIATQLDRNMLKVTISDTGQGIPAANQALLFHKFQQAGDSILTRDVSGGTGLGLYIAKLVTEGMGGQIWLEQSQVGQGSTFAFTLPLATSEQIANKTRKVGYG